MTTFTDAELDDLLCAIKTYHQIDEEGVMVGVSRQACHEAADAITYLRAQRREDALQYLSDEGQIADRIDAAVKAAVDAERKRCAGIAAMYFSKYNRSASTGTNQFQRDTAMANVARLIADDIRASTAVDDSRGAND